MDHEVLTKEDLCSQYLAPHDSVGANRAQSSLMRLQRLNPMVEVAADTSNLADATKEFFDGKFDIVIVTHCTSKDVLLAVNKVFSWFGSQRIDMKYYSERPKTGCPKTGKLKIGMIFFFPFLGIRLGEKTSKIGIFFDISC